MSPLECLESGRASCTGNVSGLVFSFEEGKCVSNQVYEKVTEFTGLIIFSNARRTLLPSSPL